MSSLTAPGSGNPYAGKSVVVTGGAGFIGSHVVDQLARQAPRRLVVIDNLWLGHEANLSSARELYPDLEFVKADASDFTSLDELIGSDPFDLGFHLATVPLPASLVDPVFCARTITEMSTAWLELARAGRVKKLIQFSTSEIYGTAVQIPMDEEHPIRPHTPYAAAKAAADHLLAAYVRTFGVDAMTIRPFNTYGPRQNDGSYAGLIPIVVRRLERGEPIEIHGDGEQTRDFSFVEDVASATVALGGRELPPGTVVNVGSGRSATVNEIVEAMIDAWGPTCRPEIHHVAERRGDVRNHLSSADRLHTFIDVGPAVQLGDGIRRTVNWYRDR